MNIILPYWGTYRGLPYAIRCATMYGGCPVYVVSDDAIVAENFISIRQFHETDQLRLHLENIMEGPGSLLHARSISRWFAVRDMLETFSIPLPVFIADWDVLIFSDLKQTHLPFAGCDFAVSIHEGDTRTAPLFLNRIEPLHAFCDLVSSMVKVKSPYLPIASDMTIWTQNTNLHNWKYADTAVIQNGSVFDHQLMHDEDGKYVLDLIGKRIEWVNRKPYFMLSKDRSLIRANTLHCWGPYKGFERELVLRSLDKWRT